MLKITTEDDIIEFAIQKLRMLKLKAEIEDRKRGKKRWVSQVSAYQDLINLLKDFNSH